MKLLWRLVGASLLIMMLVPVTLSQDDDDGFTKDDPGVAGEGEGAEGAPAPAPTDAAPVPADAAPVPADAAPAPADAAPAPADAAPAPANAAPAPEEETTTTTTSTTPAPTTTTTTIKPTTTTTTAKAAAAKKPAPAPKKAASNNGRTMASNNKTTNSTPDAAGNASGTPVAGAPPGNGSASPAAGAAPAAAAAPGTEAKKAPPAPAPVKKPAAAPAAKKIGAAPPAAAAPTASAGSPPASAPKAAAGSAASALDPSGNPKDIYFDKTVAANTVLQTPPGDAASLSVGTEMDGMKRNLFLTTDSVVSNLASINPVGTLMDTNADLKDSNLYISFRVTKGDDINRDHISNIIHHAFDDPAVDDATIGGLKKHVTSIILDLQGNTTICPQAATFEEYKRKYPEYNLKWSISLPKYMKMYASKLLGKPDLTVGVLYNQLGCYKLVQQMSDADFLVIKRSFVIDKKFPLTYNRFRAHLEYIADFNSKHLQTIGMPPDAKVMFMLNLLHNNLEINPDFQGVDEQIVQTLLDRSAVAHYPLLKQFARRWSLTEGRTELILADSMNLAAADIGTKLDPGKWHVPLLNVLEVDTKPCQLMSMLANIYSQYSNMVVNEYTWRAIARYSKEMTAENCPKAIKPTTFPEISLIFSNGIGRLWNNTERLVRRLLDSHKSVPSGSQLKTLIFHSDDAYFSTCPEGICKPEYTQKDIKMDVGIPKFATDMKAKYSIGCLVKMGDKLSGVYRYTGQFDLGRTLLNRTTMKECKGLWEVSTVIVWSFEVPLRKELVDEFSFDSGKDHFKRNMLRVLGARERFREGYPNKEVILQLVFPNDDEFLKKSSSQPGKLLCLDAVSKQNDFYKAIQTWAALHEIKIISSPAYSLNTPMRGMWLPPAADGTPDTLDMDADNCEKVTNYY